MNNLIARAEIERLKYRIEDQAAADIIEAIIERLDAQAAEIERLRNKIDHIGVKHPQDLLTASTRSIEQDHQ
jgi:hypothetical protein